MENINFDYNIEWGILIHQLPQTFHVKAIKVLPKEVKHTFIDESGMRVYFQRKEKCDEFIRKKFIDLDGILFNIYSTVTCLTVFRISSFVSRETIETYLKAKGMCVHDLYQIKDTCHYRIILDVPEVLANIELSPISLDSNVVNNFPIEFYCRICCREGHKQYQCLHSRTENQRADDTGNGSDGASSNNTRYSNQGNAVRPSVSGVRNTGGRTMGVQIGGNLSALEKTYLPEANPSTSIMKTDTGSLMKKKCNMRPGSNKGVRNTGGRTTGVQSVGNLSARENADLPDNNPSTSSMPTSADSHMRRKQKLTPRCNKVVLEKARRRPIRSIKNTKRRPKMEYPCKEIVKITMKVRGILSSEALCDFLEAVHFKRNVIKYANKFTQDIPQLIEQIKSIISHYEQQNSRSSIANKDIRMLEDLCKRLDSQMSR